MTKNDLTNEQIQQLKNYLNDFCGEIVVDNDMIFDYDEEDRGFYVSIDLDDEYPTFMVNAWDFYIDCDYQGDVFGYLWEMCEDYSKNFTEKVEDMLYEYLFYYNL